MQRTRQLRLMAVSGVLALGLVAGNALAGQTLSGAQIQDLIAGNTVQGAMEDSGAYTEFYQADGTIKGKDYTGKWTVEGDAMCFVYKPEDPKMCWGVAMNNDEIRWVNAGGKVDGTGTVVKGNPNNF